MITKYHIEMTADALASHFSKRALDAIAEANVKQDALRNQFGHDEIHYDNDAFEAGDRYVAAQFDAAVAALREPNAAESWAAFGRALHTVQDFYAHSNYVTLWLNQFDAAPPAPTEIDPLKKELMQSPSLRSGKIYLPLDFLYFIKPMRPWVLKNLPKDSHGWMNLDAPEQGFKFDYAIAAATKRTTREFNLLCQRLTAEMKQKFADK
ncbi:MAG: hypothetical protein LC099_03350 [Anaerolineales bacterium]|nr:hypothetical protein [Anaerolineales bacterium]